MVIVVTGGRSPGDDGELRGMRDIFLMPVPFALQWQRSGNGFELSWPGYATNYVLQVSPRVDGTNWVEVPGPFALQNGRFLATSEVVGTNQFFRLRQK